MTKLNDTEFSLLREYLLTACGIDVTPEKRYLFTTRLIDLMESLGCGSFSELYTRLKHGDDAALRRRLVEAMTTHETSFFRDQHPFDNLALQVLPAQARRRIEECTVVTPRLRLLCAGCSTGEEAYSVAICVKTWLQTQDRFGPADVTVMAVDISRAVLDRARAGRYPHERLKGLPAAWRDAHFTQAGDTWLVNDDVRAMVTFCEANLSEPMERLGCFDIILCRNVIIYFAAALKAEIVRQFHSMLNPGGALILGASENLYGVSDAFVTRHLGKTTCYLKEGANAS